MPDHGSGVTTSKSFRYFLAAEPCGWLSRIRRSRCSADVSRFRRGIGKRNGTVEGDPRLVVATELHQEGAPHAKEMKIIR